MHSSCYHIFFNFIELVVAVVVGDLETIYGVLLFYFTDVDNDILLVYALTWFHCLEIDLV